MHFPFKVVFRIALLFHLFQNVSHAVNIIKWEDLKPISCPVGSEFLMFSLQQFKGQLDPSDIARVVPGISKITMAQGSVGLRLDVCRMPVEQTTLLQRIVFRSAGFSPAEAFSTADADFLSVEGVSEALFGDYSNLKILIRNKADERGILLRGISPLALPNEPYLAAMNILFSPNQSWTTMSRRSVVGRLELGDGLTGGPCEIGQVLVKREFTLGAVQFGFDTCEFMGAGHTTGYVIAKLSVKDSSSKVPAGSKDVTIVLEGDRLNSQTKYKYHHHNACDSFVVRIDELDAIYTATAAPNAGCGAPIAGAPRQNDQEGVESRALFQFTYGNHPEPIQKADFKHYLFR